MVDWRNRLNSELETKNISLDFDNIMIEVTRRCNLRCEHCMRGDPQNIDMSDAVLDRIIEQCSVVGHLSLTGGEPFLVPDIIEKLVDKIISQKKEVWRLTTVDNGTILDVKGIRCIEALNRLATYIYNDVWNDDAKNAYKDGTNSKPVHVSISNSKYHINDIQTAIEFYKKYANEFVNIDDQGEWDSGFKDKNGNIIRNKDIKGEGRWLKKEGRAKDNKMKMASYTTSTYMIDLYADDEKSRYYVDTGIQICANGNVVTIEPLSFETMDQKNMGNILQEPLLDMIYKWNWTEPLTRAEVMYYCDNLRKIENPKIPEDRKIRLQLHNSVLDTKKLLLVEGHNDYPYLTHEELRIAVIAKLSLIYCGWKNENETEENIIQSVIRSQLADGENFDEKYTKKEMEDLLYYYVSLNRERLLEDKGISGVIKYYVAHIGHNKEYYNKLRANTYDK